MWKKRYWLVLYSLYYIAVGLSVQRAKLTEAKWTKQENENATSKNLYNLTLNQSNLNDTTHVWAQFHILVTTNNTIDQIIGDRETFSLVKHICMSWFNHIKMYTWVFIYQQHIYDEFDKSKQHCDLNWDWHTFFHWPKTYLCPDSVILKYTHESSTLIRNKEICNDVIWSW